MTETIEVTQEDIQKMIDEERVNYHYELMSIREAHVRNIDKERMDYQHALTTIREARIENIERICELAIANGLENPLSIPQNKS